MRAVWLLVLAALCARGANSGAARTRYGFYRDMEGASGAAGASRRMFGGAPVALDEFPAACALLDRYWSAHCSGAVLAPRWALTAAHCVSTRIAFVQYNARRAADPAGDAAQVAYLYRHPDYRVVQADEGRGLDVTVLHHDLGLVRTRVDMSLAAQLPHDPVAGMLRHRPAELLQLREEVQMLGFGYTDAARRDELFAVRLRLVPCARASWLHCACAEGDAAAGGARGVCAGDSGGPVVLRGVQVGVTSMGPLECRALAQPDSGAASVFTALYHYAGLVNATIAGADGELRMALVARATRSARPARLLLALLARFGCTHVLLRFVK